MIVIKIFFEGLKQAIHQLWSNKLRSVLSLLGIAIGIFCIISVLSAVNSLEADIRKSFNRLGEDVLYIDKLPWDEDPGQNFWKYMKRPSPSYSDFRFLKEKSKLAQYVSMYFVIGAKGLKYKSNEVNNVPILAVTNNFIDVYNVEFSKGRWYSSFEYERGTDQVILGYEVAKELFGDIEAIGKFVKLRGRKLQVIGVTKKVGNSLVNPMDFDVCVLISYNLGKKISNLKANNPWASSLQVKAAQGVELADVKDEVTILLRKKRLLKPKEKDNFAINSLSIITKLFDSVFSAMTSLGWIIGFFSILVGGFSVANIMFVSVRERTALIGIKKALGARRYIILFEFLIEAVILCLIGGFFGLLFVFVTMKLLSMGLGFDMYISTFNLLLGVGGSIVIGMISGFIPAWLAAKMDPVTAIRH